MWKQTKQTHTPVVPTAPDTEKGLKNSSSSFNKSGTVNLASEKKVKLPFCAQYIVMRRVNHFTKIAVLAALATLFMSGVKFYIAIRGERSTALKSLENTGKTVANSLKLQMEADLATLDGVANMWHLDSQMSRPAFRQFVKSHYFKKNLDSFQTVILTHRIKDAKRNLTEMDPAAVQLRQDCCNTTKYDTEEGSICRKRAKNQCNIQGPHRYYFTEVVPQADGSRKVLQSAQKDEYLIVMYQEPLELNPGPTGLDMFTLPSRRDAFWEADRTGKKGVTRRMQRVFAAVPEFGLLVWNNVFADKERYENTTILEGVELLPKQKLLDNGKIPYSIGSVVAVYQLQRMMINLVTRVFGNELTDTKIYLFDNRDTTPKKERLLAMYDPLKEPVQMNEEVMQLKNICLDELSSQADAQVNYVLIDDTEMKFAVVMLPSESYFKTSSAPYYILGISIALVAVAQVERWMGHPWIVSQNTLVRSSIEAEIREEVEESVRKRFGAEVAAMQDQDDLMLQAQTKEKMHSGIYHAW